MAHGNQFFEAHIIYTPILETPFHNYGGEKGRIESINQKDENLLVEERFKKLTVLNPNVKFKGHKSGIVVRCENLYNDEKGVYLKFLFDNESSISYEIDHVSFSYVSKMKKKGINRLQSLGIEEVDALKSVEPSKTIATQKSNKYMYYVPLYATIFLQKWWFMIATI